MSRGFSAVEGDGTPIRGGPTPEGERRPGVTSGSIGEAVRKAEPTAFGRSPFAGKQREAEKGTDSATFGLEGTVPTRVDKGSLNFTNRARLISERKEPIAFEWRHLPGEGEPYHMATRVEQGDSESSNLGLPQREGVRPTIWQTLTPLAPMPAIERTETAQGPRAIEAEVRGVGSRKRDRVRV